MKKLKRLIEIKRQVRLVDTKIIRADKRRESLVEERAKIINSLTEDEKRLYKDRIEVACK